MNNVKHRKKRQLRDLISVGNAALKDFEVLGIKTVDSLSRQDARELYLRLCNITKKQHDICVEDVFSAAIAQSRNPTLSFEKSQWWYWSRIRKGKNGKNK